MSGNPLPLPPEPPIFLTAAVEALIPTRTEFKLNDCLTGRRPGARV